MSSSEDHFEQSVSEETKSSFFEAFVKVWELTLKEHSQIATVMICIRTLSMNDFRLDKYMYLCGSSHSGFLP